MMKAEDMGEFYRIPSDNRDLNYAKYFSEGKEVNANIQDYNSHNTKRLNLNELKSLLHKLDIIKENIN